MKKYITMLLSMVLLVGCSPYGNIRANLGMGYDTIDYGSRVSRDRTRAHISLQYLSREYFANKIIEDTKSFHYSMQEQNKLLQEIPKSGYLALDLGGHTLQYANPQNWYIMIKDDNGNLIQRLEGENEIPSFSVSEYGVSWYEYQLIPIDFEIPTPFKVTVISKLNKRYNEFTVWPNYEETGLSILGNRQRNRPYSIMDKVHYGEKY